MTAVKLELGAVGFIGHDRLGASTMMDTCVRAIAKLVFLGTNSGVEPILGADFDANAAGLGDLSFVIRGVPDCWARSP